MTNTLSSGHYLICLVCPNFSDGRYLKIKRITLMHDYHQLWLLTCRINDHAHRGVERLALQWLTVETLHNVNSYRGTRCATLCTTLLCR